MEKLLNLIKEQNDRDHKEIKETLGFILKSIAPRVAANEKAITIILMVIAAAGYAKAFGAF